MVENENETIDGTLEEAEGADESGPRRGRHRRVSAPKPATSAVSASGEDIQALTDLTDEATDVDGPDDGQARVVEPSDDDASDGESDEAAMIEDVTATAPPPVVRPGLQVLFQAPPALPTPSARSVPRPVDDVDETDDAEADEESEGGLSRRSRRRTRRRGSTETAEAPVATEVVPKAKPVREPITEPQKLKGSTRLEAKRQRRRDGRDAGRRRTVVTEAEFLARREAVDRFMVVRNTGDRAEIAVLEDGVLAEHYVAKSQNVSLIGNVYLGRVQNVLPSMEAAFVDIGRGRNAVLYSGEVDWEAASDRLGDKGSQARRIELALKPGDRVLVQVTKDPVGHKGARLTSSVSLPGRYLVYVPNGSMNGISRKLPDTERARLKRILKDALPDSAGVIVRTAAEGATEEQLVIDIQRLANQWAEIEHLVEAANAPALLHSEPGLLVKIVRDVFNEDFTKLLIAGADARATIEKYLGSVAPDLLDRIETWEAATDPFEHFRVHEQIEKALDRKVWLPSGGSLVIDRTEAMTVIDVNTGKFVGSGGNLEETVTKNNLEAAEEIVRQLRLRDIGGIIVIDFIDMVLESNRDLVLRRLVECLSRDRTKHQVAEVTSLGLVQMTRKRLGVGLAESVEDAGPADARQDPQQGRRRRGSGNGNGGGVPAPTKTVAPHAITPDVKKGLAQIAGATITAPARTPEQDEHADPDEAGVVPEVSLTVEVVPPGTDSPAGLLDLPLDPPTQPAPRIPEAAAAGLLDSVLEALPEPKRPGQGRRSRRVSTPALTPGQQG